ncbi:MAG: PIN domain-containing protein [Deltaproteobacteria bacterium]|nr:PIN domain-containing protein [Deltaproteobacteria bacterium]
MSDKIFVDTNILVYSRDASETEKQPQAMHWMRQLWTSKAGRLSFQVLQEFYSIVTTKLQPGMEPQKAREDIESLFVWNPIPVKADVIKRAWQNIDKFQLSWWDSLIVSAAQIGGCTYLLTEDLQENQILGSVCVINPFLNSPESLDLQI